MLTSSSVCRLIIYSRGGREHGSEGERGERDDEHFTLSLSAVELVAWQSVPITLIGL